MWFQKKTLDVICVGSTSKDIFFPTDEGVVLETPGDITAKQKVAFELGGKYRVADRFEAVGGVAANVSCGLARLGYATAVYSCVGQDEIGRYVLHTLKDEGVSTELIHEYADAKTDLSAIIVLVPSGERTIFHNRDANERLTVVAELLPEAKYFFVSALNGDWKKNLTTLLAAKKASGVKLAYNPGQHNIREDAGLILATLRDVDVLLLNKDEATELLLKLPNRPTDEELNDECFLLKQLHEAGARVIGMTDGKRGAWGYDGNEFWHCPIHTRKDVVDSTGAGDAFGSGFLAALMAGHSLSEALQSGIAESGSVVGFYGAIEGLLSSGELEELMAATVLTKLK